MSAAAVTTATMMATGRPSEGGHWYDRAGNCVYEVRGANGAMRSTHLGDARKLGLLPGVSSILNMEAAPQLEQWKIKQAMMACLTLPRLPGETEDAFMERALEDSKQQAAKARDKGTAIHAAIQGFYEGKPTDASWWPYISKVEAELNMRYGPKAVWESEKSFGHEHGFGGKSDLICRGPNVVVDIKSKAFDADLPHKLLAYPQHAMQLAAYARGFGMPNAECINIFVSTTTPGLVRARLWEPAEIDEAAQAFDCLLKLWKIRKKYDGAW